MEGLGYVLNQVRKEIAQLRDDLGEGVAKDYAEYRFICGRIYALSILEGDIEDKIKGMENE